MRLLRHLLLAVLALGLIANGIVISHAMPCAPAAAMAMPHDHGHMANHDADHHAGHLAMVAGDDGASAVSDRAASDDQDAVASCNCGCASLCAVSDVAHVRIETPQRHAVAVSYVSAAQPVADGIQFIDPGIPIRLA